ncbi:MAG TPA: hypothetical protein VK934_01520 [Fimbriimonas sp.]|nr:hypothetical protein [Fimbriimonas sp.]
MLNLLRILLALIVFGTMLSAWCGLLIGAVALFAVGALDRDPVRILLGVLLLAVLGAWSWIAMKGAGPDNLGI